ncbi:hypothetical protein ABPG73_017274 [Tetrahymena malaccensis]
MDILIKQLQIEKQISVTQSYVDKVDSKYTFLASDDKDRQFSIRAFFLASDLNSNICDEKLNSAKQFAQNLRDCNHQNILKYVEEFQIDKYYLVVMERFEMNLIDWQYKIRLKKKINRNLFLKMALDLFKALEYLHSKNLLLQQLTLKNIYLDKEHNLKICDFNYPQEIIPSLATQQFVASKTYNLEFYLPPELYDYSKNVQNKQFKVLQEKEGDIWQTGLCIYALTGITLLFVKRLTKGTGFFLFQEKLDNDICKFLMNIFWQNPKLRPSVSDLIDSIQQLQNKQVEEIDEEEDYKPEFVDLYIEGKELYSNEQYQEAIEVLKKALEIEPQPYQLLNLLGNVSYELKNYEEANEYFQKSIQLYPKNSFSYKCLGHSYLNMKKLEEAVIQLNKSIEINSEYSHAYNVLGVCYERLQMEDKAEEAYKISHSLNPQQSLPSCNLGYLYERKQNFEESESWLKKSIEINPNNYDAIIELSFLYYNQSKYQEALTYCKQALEIDPLQEEPIQNIGRIYLHLEQYDEAIDCLKKAIQVNDKMEYMYFTLAFAYLQKLKYNQTIYCLKKQIQIDNSDIESFGMIGEQYLHQKKYEKVIKFKKYYKKDEMMFLDLMYEAKSQI